MNLKHILSLPFRAVRRMNNWLLSEPSEEGSLRQRFPAVFFQPSENVTIGERVFIGAGCLFVAKETITIGNDTMIAPHVVVTTSTHDPSQNPMWKKAIFRPVSIGEHVWIGVGAIILPGVKIGAHAIVGAGAVVSRHVPNGAVVVGNPARISHFREIPPLDVATQSRYPYWEEVLEDYLPADKTTKSL